MARKKRQFEPENHERWLVSYADFITLLFAFFVVMFASSQADHAKAQQVSDSVRAALDGTRPSALVSAILGGTIHDTGQGNAQHNGPAGDVGKKNDGQQKDKQLDLPPNPLLPSLEILIAELAEEIKDGQIQISMTPRGLVISFAQAALFPSGEDLISTKSYTSLAKVGAAIARLPNPVRLEGHTDSKPIKTPRFKSNWDLSASRSIALLKVLTERFGVPANRMSVAGYADTAPLASNDTEEGRAHNRRVDIVVLNEQGVKGEPAKLNPVAAPTSPAASKPSVSPVPAVVPKH